MPAFDAYRLVDALVKVGGSETEAAALLLEWCDVTDDEPTLVLLVETLGTVSDVTFPRLLERFDRIAEPADAYSTDAWVLRALSGFRDRLVPELVSRLGEDDRGLVALAGLDYLSRDLMADWRPVRPAARPSVRAPRVCACAQLLQVLSKLRYGTLRFANIDRLACVVRARVLCVCCAACGCAMLYFARCVCCVLRTLCVVCGVLCAVLRVCGALCCDEHAVLCCACGVCVCLCV